MPVRMRASLRVFVPGRAHVRGGVRVRPRASARRYASGVHVRVQLDVRMLMSCSSNRTRGMFV
eukprot:2859241-Pleurochrysis_carterae.AAC.1